MLPSSGFRYATLGARRVGPLLMCGYRFSRFCVAVVALLPLSFNSVVAASFLGFVLINGLTFRVDLLFLSGLHAGLRMPIPFAVYLGRFWPTIWRSSSGCPAP
jgi:hypothetical protein